MGRLCDDYEGIAEKALTTPANTEELMELKAYIEKVESDTIFVMEKRLMASKERLTFLSDHAQFSPAEIRLNAQVFMWHGRMPAVFEEHKLIVSEKRTQYEEALKARLRIEPTGVLCFEAILAKLQVHTVLGGCGLYIFFSTTTVILKMGHLRKEAVYDFDPDGIQTPLTMKV